jgi:hypothetical protein
LLLKFRGFRKEGSKVQGSAFRVDVFDGLAEGIFQPLNPEPFDPKP